MSRRAHSENFKLLCVVAGNICSIAARQEVLRVPPFISLFLSLSSSAPSSQKDI